MKASNKSVTDIIEMAISLYMSSTERTIPSKVQSGLSECIREELTKDFDIFWQRLGPDFDSDI